MDSSRSTHGILLSPATSSGLILGPVSFVHVSNFRNKWIIRIGVRQQRAYRQEHLPYRTQKDIIKDSTSTKYFRPFFQLNNCNTQVHPKIAIIIQLVKLTSFVSSPYCEVHKALKPNHQGSSRSGSYKPHACTDIK